MGLYIKGAKPLNDCYECPCKEWVDDGCAGCWADDKIHNASRPDDCPLIEVKEPHGALIDRDALKDIKFTDINHDYRLGWNEAIEAIMENADVIIEGSEANV